MHDACTARVRRKTTMDSIRRTRLDILTGGFDGGVETECAHCDDGAHVGASMKRCKQVRSYRYTSPNYSLCERLFLNRFWNYLVAEWTPEWLAPNAMTVGGLACIVVGYVLVWFTSPGLEFEAPRWVYVACAVLAFVYQTADGMDGKQARKTKSGSPLGEVVDHACDALSMCFYPLVVVDIFAVGFASAAAKATAIVVMFTGRAMFVVDTVSSTYSGVLPVSEFLDSQEIQLISQTLFILAAMFGNGFLFNLSVDLPYVGTQTLGRVGAVFCITTGAVARVGTFAKTIIGSKNHEPPHWPKHRSPVRIAIQCALCEAFHGFCIYKAKNFAYAHATSALLFGESEARIMTLRVSDPDFPVTNWLALLVMALTTLVPAGDAFTSGILIGAALFMLLHRGSALAAQITGCLGMHPNIFVIRKTP